GVDAEHQAGGDQGRAEDVRARLEAQADVTGQDAHGDREGGDADRQVDEEDPVPAERVGEDAAEHLADGGACRAGEAEDGDGLGALAGVGEQRHEDAQADGGRHRAADALEEAGGDQYGGRGGRAGQQRGGGEDGDSGEEHAPAADQVAEPAGQQEQAAERDEVGVDDPAQAGGGEPQVALDGRHRHGHDGAVEDDHQHPGGDDPEGDPS